MASTFLGRIGEIVSERSGARVGGRAAWGLTARPCRRAAPRRIFQVPNFTAETTQGSITLYDYLGEAWGVLFSHPADFTPCVASPVDRVRASAG